MCAAIGLEKIKYINYEIQMIKKRMFLSKVCNLRARDRHYEKG